MSILASGEVRHIELNHGYYATVDARDFDWLSEWEWKIDGSGYAVRYYSEVDESSRKRTERALMHREIFEHYGNRLGNLEIDHRDRQKLNNVYSNLRLATRTQNRANSSRRSDNKSGVTGVCYNKKTRKWQAHITLNNKTLYLGSFSEKVDAIAVRKQAILQHFGEYANTSDDLTPCPRILKEIKRTDFYVWDPPKNT